VHVSLHTRRRGSPASYLGRLLARPDLVACSPSVLDGICRNSLLDLGLLPRKSGPRLDGCHTSVVGLSCTVFLGATHPVAVGWPSVLDGICRSSLLDPGLLPRKSGPRSDGCRTSEVGVSSSVTALVALLFELVWPCPRATHPVAVGWPVLGRSSWNRSLSCVPLAAVGNARIATCCCGRSCSVAALGGG